MKGISTNRYCTQAVECIKKANYDFVIRYYSRTTKQPEKRMLPPEAQAISKAGLLHAIVYQDLSNILSYFTRERGIKDGRYAHTYADNQIGQPAGSAIYFAVDWDPEIRSQITGPIADYFRGVNQALEESSGGQKKYDIGVYGSGLVCRLIRSNLPFVRYSWLALATDWQESDTYNDWNIKQFKVTENLCGIPIDEKGKQSWQRVEVKNDFGQFSLETT